MTAAVLTPFTGAAGTQAGGRWRKKLLPVGEIHYKGRVLKFDRPYLSGLVDAFRARAYDQVPFQLAGDDNKHTNDVERTGGHITDMKLADDGLYIEVQPSQRGARVLSDNPGLGVSARIIEGYDRSDGQHFPRAIQHVLGTLDPRIPGMGGWEALAASNDAEITFDLSGERYAGEEPGMAELTDDQQARLAKLLDLDPDKLGELVASMADVEGLNGEPPGDDDEIQAIADAIDGMSDEELQALEAELEAEESGAQPVGAGLANDDAAMALELAAAQGDENARQLEIIQRQLDQERWQGERDRLVAGGTPPYIADLAQPLLEGAGHVVDLSNGKSVDAGQITRAILTEYQKLGAQLGLGVELGTAMDEPGDSDETKARDDVVTRAKAQLFGMH